MANVPARTGHRLTLDRVTHRFGDVTAVERIELDIAGGELVALLGPSGCGKSTLLRIIAGFLAQSEGRVLFDAEAVDHLAPTRRGAGIVFQNYALFPHMTVRQNVAYGLEARRISKPSIAGRVAEMLELVHMEAYADRLPRQLSGGQQQRIALARALAVDPKILLLDEPFGALDKNLRLDMQIEVKRLQREYGITTILVTHDQEEALSMADRIAVMNRGRIEQVSSPIDVYDRPRTVFVNQFVGTTNLLPGEIVDDVQGVVHLEGGGVIKASPAPGLVRGARVVVSVRPEQLRIQTTRSDHALAATIKAVLPLGPYVMYEAQTEGGVAFRISEPRDAGARLLAPGTFVHVMPVAPGACNVFAAEHERAA
ncbi:MAG TPA: ABC transporter ATP-binding protein [Casimicrobiaceae bacterium]|nr:ABC transporter ATP-binding protein [Casimicrobiaceae bacterium]